MRFLLDDLAIDTKRQRVTRGDAVLDVQGLTFRLLEALLARGTAVATYDELMAAVWAPAVVNEETVTQRVKLLRQALDDDGKRPRYVRAVRGQGYQLCAVPRVVEEATEVLPSGASATEDLSTGIGGAPVRSTWRDALVRHSRLAVVGGLLAVAFVVFGVADTFDDLAGVPAATPAPAAPAEDRDERLSRARHYFAIGQKDDNERAIALYQQALAQAPDDRAARLGLSFAYSARVCLHDFEWTWAERAAELADAALAQSPDDSLAHAARGYAHDCLGQIDGAVAHYERAVAIAPTERWDSMGSLANLYAVQGRLADALRVNLQIDAARVSLRFLDLQIARNLELLGDAAAAERRYRHSFDLQPDNVFSNAAYPAFLLRQGRFADAEAALAVARARPFHPDLLITAGELALLRGDAALATREFVAAQAMRPHQSKPSTLAALYGDTPPTADWLTQRATIVRGFITDGERWPDAWLELAWIEIARGNGDDAVEALSGAVAAGFLDVAWLRTTPLLREIRNTPAFRDLLERVSARVQAERQAAEQAGLIAKD